MKDKTTRSHAKRRVFVGLALVLSAGTFPFSPAMDHHSARAGTSAVKIRRTSVFRARTTKTILLRLPRRINVQKGLRIGLDGDGRAWGFVLTSAWKAPGRGPTIMASEIGACRTRGCHTRYPNTAPFILGSGFDRYLPRGLYRLYLIADGAPVELTLRFRSLSGRLTSRPRSEVKTQIKLLPEKVTSGPLSTTYTAGDFTALENTGFSFFGLWLKAGNHVSTEVGDCTYRTEEEAPPAAAFEPGCPTGEGDRYSFESERPAESDEGIVFTSLDLRGREGQGGWFTSASSVKRFGAIGFWMEW